MILVAATALIKRDTVLLGRLVGLYRKRVHMVWTKTALSPTGD
jgi:hypothetical protein